MNRLLWTVYYMELSILALLLKRSDTYPSSFFGCHGQHWFKLLEPSAVYTVDLQYQMDVPVPIYSNFVRGELYRYYSLLARSFFIHGNQPGLVIELR